MRLLARGSAGLILWAFGFSLLYALHGLGCSKGWDSLPFIGGSVFGSMMGAVWLALACGSIAIVWWARARPEGFERQLATATAWAGLAGIILTGAPIAIVSHCT